MSARAKQIALGLIALAAVAVAARRGAADAPPGKYTIPGDGTVVDTSTSLTWQRAVPAQSYTWSQAMTYCANPGLPGAGWRLPSMKELQTIVDESSSNPAVDSSAFPNTPGEFFWASSPVAGAGSEAWGVYFDSGVTGGVGTFASGRVRCVR